MLDTTCNSAYFADAYLTVYFIKIKCGILNVVSGGQQSTTWCTAHTKERLVKKKKKKEKSSGLSTDTRLFPVSSAQKDTLTGLVCVYGCVINQQRPDLSAGVRHRPTRTLPHVSEGTKFLLFPPQFFFFALEQMSAVTGDTWLPTHVKASH